MGLTAFNRMRRSKAGNVVVSEAEVEPILSLPDIRERAKELGIPNAGKKSGKRLIQEIQEVSAKLSAATEDEDSLENASATKGGG